VITSGTLTSTEVGIPDLNRPNWNEEIQLMIEIINHIGNTTCPGNYKLQQSIPVKRNDSNGKRDFSIISFKFILEDNKIAFERYDRNGKLISRVPWTAHRVSAEA